MVATTLKVPASVVADDHRRTLWESASEDERFMAAALCEMSSGLSVERCRHYLEFAERIKKRFIYKSVQFKYGDAVVLKASQIAGVSRVTCYSILQVARCFSLADYNDLAARAAARGAGAVVQWCHLRVLTSRPEHKRERTRLALKLTRRYYTVTQLHQLIDAEVPEVRRKSAGGSSCEDTVCEAVMETDTVCEISLKTIKATSVPSASLPVSAERSPEEIVASMVAALDKCGEHFSEWEEGLQKLSHCVQECDERSVRPLWSQMTTTMDSLERMGSFVEKARHVLTLLQSQARAVRSSRAE